MIAGSSVGDGATIPTRLREADDRHGERTGKQQQAGRGLESRTVFRSGGWSRSRGLHDRIHDAVDELGGGAAEQRDAIQVSSGSSGFMGSPGGGVRGRGGRRGRRTFGLKPSQERPQPFLGPADAGLDRADLDRLDGGDLGLREFSISARTKAVRCSIGNRSRASSSAVHSSDCPRPSSGVASPERGSGSESVGEGGRRRRAERDSLRAIVSSRVANRARRADRTSRGGGRLPGTSPAHVFGVGRSANEVSDEREYEPLVAFDQLAERGGVSCQDRGDSRCVIVHWGPRG